MNREEIGSYIFDRLSAAKTSCSQQYERSQSSIAYFVVDELLPPDLAKKIFTAFPTPDDMVLKSSLRERKYIDAQMNKHLPILEEIIYAFQTPDIVKLIGEITNIRAPEPDGNLYAGGISLMGKDCFLNPHLDNSHDKDRNRWRVLNLLYYVTPDWDPADGGNLELWPQGPKAKPVVVPSLFNRLVVMSTHGGSWHSVSPVLAEKARCCVSNYYFSPEPVRKSDRFHVTSFRGRPEQLARDLLLGADIKLRMLVRKIFPKGIKENPHVYRK